MIFQQKAGNKLRELTFHLADNSNINFTNFDEALKFSVKEFGFKGEVLDSCSNIHSLYHYLKLQEIDVEINNLD